MNACLLILPALVMLADGPIDAEATIDRQRRSLLALARLHRLVAPHHPSLDAANADWPARLRKAIPDVLRAEDDDQLTQALQQYVAGLEGPPIEIGPPNPKPPDDVVASRDGPVVRWIDDVLYVALSPGNCCPSAIPDIEAALEESPDNAVGWVLDLRETRYRGFGSIYSEVKVTLAWAFEAGARTPPRIGRQHLQTPATDRPELLPARTYVESERLAIPDRLAVLVDESTNPAAIGWLLGTTRNSDVAIYGTPAPVLADWPCEVPLSETLQARCVLTRYVSGPMPKYFCFEQICPDLHGPDIPALEQLASLPVFHQIGVADGFGMPEESLLCHPGTRLVVTHPHATLGMKQSEQRPAPKDGGDEHAVVEEISVLILQLAAVEPANDQCPTTEDAADASFFDELNKLLIPMK